MVRLLLSKVGFNSLSALIEKYGWEAIRPKFEAIDQWVYKYKIDNYDLVIKSIINLERDHLHEKVEPKFLV